MPILPEKHVAMQTSDVQRLDGALFRDDKLLRSAMHGVAAPSYHGTPGVLDYEAEMCESLYLSTDASGIRSFFMVAPTTLAVGNSRVPAVFMGLSAVREDLKGTGQSRSLFRAFAADVRRRERLTGQRELLFATFATPSTLFAFEQLFADVSPRRDGTFHSQYTEALPAIHQFLRTSCDPDVPFRLPGHAKTTRYSAAERSRIASICERKDFDLFRRLNIKEESGDRLIMCARVPMEVAD